jgi:hypothetical protein
MRARILLPSIVVAAACGSGDSDPAAAIEAALADGVAAACAEPRLVPVPPASGDAVLYGVKALGRTAFAVGYYWDSADVCDRAGTFGSCTKPLIVRYDDGGWSLTLPVPPPSAAAGGDAHLVNSWLYAVDGTDTSDVWAVGTRAADDGPQTCVVDGDCDNAPVLDPSVPFNVPRNLRACGGSGHCIRYSDLIYHFDGRTWTRLDSSPGARLSSDWGGPLLTLAAFARGAVDFFGNGPPLPGYTAAVGLHFDGAGFETIMTGPDAPGLTFTALRLDPDEEWLGGDGELWHRVRSTWSTVPIPLPRPTCDDDACGFYQINSIRPDGASAGALWAVGTGVDLDQGALAQAGCDPTDPAADATCNAGDVGPVTCVEGVCTGCGADSDCASGLCIGGVCSFHSGLNHLYSAHYDGSAWSSVAVGEAPDSNQCLWSLATRARATATEAWAVGGATPDAVDINLGKNCLDVAHAETLVEYLGAPTKGQWRLASPLRAGLLFGVDVLPRGRALAVGTSLRGGTFRAVSQLCGTAE